MTKSQQNKVQRLLKLFNNGHQVHIAGARAENVQVSEAIGRNENQVVYLEWRENNESFSIKITKTGLAGAKINETAIQLKDEEGEPVTLQFTDPSGVVPVAMQIKKHQANG